MATKDTKQSVKPLDIEVSCGRDEAESSPYSLETRLLSKSRSTNSGSGFTTPTAASLRSVSSMDRNEVPTPQSDGVSDDVMDTKGLVDRSKVVQAVGLIDNENSNLVEIYAAGDMEAPQAQSLAKRSIVLEVYRGPLFIGSNESGRGQAGLVIDRDDVLRVVTAKHLLQKITKNGNTHEVVSLEILSPGVKDQRISPVFEDENCEKQDPGVPLRDGAFWKSGIDIAFSEELLGNAPPVALQHYNDNFSGVVDHFSMVREDFEFEVGQKIGMVVYNPYTVKPTNPAITGSGFQDEALTEEELLNIYGPAQAIVIHKGEISFVGTHHIEYMINTYQGCSGAIVFLLDEGQPSSVHPEDHGRAIAVHAGKHQDLGDVNVAFKLPPSESSE